MSKKGKIDITSLCGGLPEELCIQLGAEEQLVKIRLEKRKFGKEVTVIEGIDPSTYDLRKIASALKSKLATGGTVKDNHIEIQGDQRQKVKNILTEEFGIPVESIIFIETE